MTGILDRNIYEDIDWGSGDYVDYEKVYNNRFTVLHEAYKIIDRNSVKAVVKLAAGLPEYKKFDNFNKTNAYWLDDYALLWLSNGILTRSHGRTGMKILNSGHRRACRSIKSCLQTKLDSGSLSKYEFDKQWKNSKNMPMKIM